MEALYFLSFTLYPLPFFFSSKLPVITDYLSLHTNQYDKDCTTTRDAET